ncbi:hypothetical protein HDU98_008836 [Podochytrium sp. JEL0797]|nr:hypothetical protein HDU98_008836 [Podochytrium sp. JEL0797]
MNSNNASAGNLLDIPEAARIRTAPSSPSLPRRLTKLDRCNSKGSILRKTADFGSVPKLPTHPHPRLKFADEGKPSKLEIKTDSNDSGIAEPFMFTSRVPKIVQDDGGQNESRITTIAADGDVLPHGDIIVNPTALSQLQRSSISTSRRSSKVQGTLTYDDSFPGIGDDISAQELGLRQNQSRKPRSVGGASTIGSSMHLSQEHLYKITQRIEAIRGGIVRSKVFQFAYRCSISTRFKIYALSLVHVLDLVFITLLVNNLAGQVLPGIGWYNFAHAVFGSLGKVGLVVGFTTCQLTAKEFVAHGLVSKGKGVPLSDVAVAPTEFNPPQGRTLRYMFLGSMLLLEGAMWYLLLFIQWTPVSTELGVFPCIPATYPVAPSFLANIPGFLSGDASLATIYNYGIPLEDGLIGGWNAWPLSAPSMAFNMEGDGVVYAYSVVCGDLSVTESNSPDDTKHPSRVRLSLIHSELWNEMYHAIIEIQFPANTHNWKEYSDRDVTQRCTIRYALGEGRVKFAFVSDEWLMVTGGQMNQITIEGQAIVKGDPEKHHFDDVLQYMGSTSKYNNMTGWFVEVFTECVSGTTYDPTQAGKISSLFQWGQNNRRQYDLNQTWQGIAGAMGSMSHYLLMQYDGNAMSNCLYSGTQGSGIITIPPLVSTLMLSSILICFVAQIFQLLSWALTSGGSPKTDRVARILNSPLLILFLLRASITDIIPEIKSGDHSSRSIRKHFEKVPVRLGESKKTRGEPIGTLVMGPPKGIVAMNDTRKYFGANGKLLDPFLD